MTMQGKRVLLIIAVAITLFILFRMLMPSSETVTSIQMTALDHAVGVGETVPLTSFIPAAAGSTVCVIEPYEDRLDEGLPLAARVNQKLSELNFSHNEIDWWIAIVTPDDVRLVKLMESSSVGFAGARQVAASNSKLPDGMSSQLCEPSETAVFTKVLMVKTPYIVLGGK